MGRSEVSATVTTTCESILDRRGLELVELSFKGESVGRVLRVTVDKVEGRVSLDELAEVSEEISRALDLEDPIDGRYTLEVSSAGIERPLVKRADYERFVGRDVKVRLDGPVDGRRNFKGRLAGSDEQSFKLDLEEGGSTQIPFELVNQAKLVVDWDEELKGASALTDGERKGL